MGPHELIIKFTLGEFCLDINFNNQIKNLFSEIEERTKELKFDRSVSSKNELFIHTNTKFYKMHLMNELINLLNTVNDNNMKQLILNNVSVKYKLQQQVVDLFRPNEKINFIDFIYEINKIDTEYY